MLEMPLFVQSFAGNGHLGVVDRLSLMLQNGPDDAVENVLFNDFFLEKSECNLLGLFRVGRYLSIAAHIFEVAVAGKVEIIHALATSADAELKVQIVLAFKFRRKLQIARLIKHIDNFVEEALIPVLKDGLSSLLHMNWPFIKERIVFDGSIFKYLYFVEQAFIGKCKRHGLQKSFCRQLNRMMIDFLDQIISNSLLDDLFLTKSDCGQLGLFRVGGRNKPIGQI